MTGDRMADVLFYGALLLLPLSALFSRRLPLGQLLRMVLSWVVIFAVGLVLVSQRDRVADLWSRASGALTEQNQTVVGDEVRIRMSADGHFWANAVIDGVKRRMLIDSGATITALSVGTASAAGLDLERSPFPAILNTANGRVTARTATVGRLELGGITARDLNVVVSPAFGEMDIIGMNFLSRLGSWRVEGRTLILNPTKPPV